MKEMTAAIIDRFVDEFRFLSNFYPSTIVVDGKQFPSIEHAYQAYKSLDPDVRETIRNAKTPGQAKRLGRCIQLRPDWEDVKVGLMRSFVRMKFENPFLRSMLLETGDATLIEGNNWNDTVWGVCRGKGRNLLGQILMEIREEILHEEDENWCGPEDGDLWTEEEIDKES